MGFKPVTFQPVVQCFSLQSPKKYYYGKANSVVFTIYLRYLSLKSKHEYELTDQNATSYHFLIFNLMFVTWQAP